MPIAQLGQVNVSALNVPQALVQIVQPQYLYGGASTNVGGIVGTAPWGPVGIPVPVGNYAQFAMNFGPTINRKYDMGIHVIAASAQGANAMTCVRVTDGTDTAAAASILTNCLTATAKYTGSLGNSVKITTGPGTQSNSFKVVVSCPNLTTEVFDNLAAGLTGNAAWIAIASAINNGSSSTRPPSNIIVASAGAGTTAVASASYTLAGGADGAGVTSSAMIGVDTVPRKGMYALRGTGIARFMLADLDDLTTVSTQVAFGLDEGAEAICVTPASDTLTNAATELSTAGVDAYAASVIFGDWVYILDTINSIPMRLISPQSLKLGLRCNLSPQMSALNKPLQGIVGTQSTVLGRTYSYADFQALATARMDLVTNQSPGGNYFAFRFGVNTSSSQVVQDDSYTDVTNFISKSILRITGTYVGWVQNADERRKARASLIEFLALAQQNGIIGTPDGSQAYQVVLDTTNNPQSAVALGFQYAYVKAVYLGIVRYFIVNMEGGASVTVQSALPAY